MIIPRRANAFLILIGINIVIFVLQNAGFDWRDQGAIWLPESPYYQHYQWLTHLFLHADIMHLVLNMYALAVLAKPINALLGNTKFLFLYLCSGLFAALCDVVYSLYLMNQQETSTLLWQHSLIGASGAVCGVAAAFAVSLPKARLGIIFLPFSLPARVFVVLFALYELFAEFSGISFFGNNIAHLAHVGGLIAGGVMAMFFRYHNNKKTPVVLPTHF